MVGEMLLVLLLVLDGTEKPARLLVVDVGGTKACQYKLPPVGIATIVSNNVRQWTGKYMGKR